MNTETNADMEKMVIQLREDEEFRRLAARHYFRAEQAKRLMRDAGYGVTGMDILETTKEVLR